MLCWKTQKLSWLVYCYLSMNSDSLQSEEDDSSPCESCAVSNHCEEILIFKVRNEVDQQLLLHPLAVFICRLYTVKRILWNGKVHLHSNGKSEFCPILTWQQTWTSAIQSGCIATWAPMTQHCAASTTGSGSYTKVRVLNPFQWFTVIIREEAQWRMVYHYFCQTRNLHLRTCFWLDWSCDSGW